MPSFGEVHHVSLQSSSSVNTAYAKTKVTKYSCSLCPLGQVTDGEVTKYSDKPGSMVTSLSMKMSALFHSQLSGYLVSIFDLGGLD